MHAAIEAVESGDRERAIALYGIAEDALPADAPPTHRIDLRIRRALVQIDAGLFRDAYRDLIGVVDDNNPDPVPLVWAAYALSMAACQERDTNSSVAFESDIALALEHYLCAEELLGVAPQALRYDIANCYLLKGEVGKATVIVDELVAEECSLHQAYHLKALVDLRQPRHEGGSSPNPEWIETAVAMSEDSRGYCFDASCIYARIAELSSGSVHDDALQRSVEFFDHAVTLGASTLEARQIAMWCPKLEQDERFQELAASASTAPASPPAPRFIEPLSR
jgi:hypothetical protein